MAVMKRLFFGVTILSLSTVGYAAASSGRRFIDIDTMIGVVEPSSFVQVRENAVEGDRLNFSRLHVRTVAVPSVRLGWWVSEKSFFAVRVREFIVHGRRTISDPIVFNGTTIAGGQTLRTNPIWFSLGAFYGRRWKFPRWSLTGSAGVDFTSLDFRFNGGHAVVMAPSVGTETKEGFRRQEDPLPVLGISTSRRLSTRILAEGSIEGGWINHLNSLRTEGGTIYLSQRQLEAHLRVRLADEGPFRRIQPMAGLFFFAFRQTETSHEDTNTVSLKAYGPELGLTVLF